MKHQQNILWTTNTTTTTTSNDDIITHQSGNVLTSPLLMDTGHGLQIKQNLGL